jgi:hypothetical protein
MNSADWPPPPGYAWLKRLARSHHYFDLRRLKSLCGRPLTQFHILRKGEVPPVECQCRLCRLKLYPRRKPRVCGICGNKEGTDQRDFVSSNRCGVCAPRVQRSEPRRPWWTRSGFNRWWIWRRR